MMTLPLLFLWSRRATRFPWRFPSSHPKSTWWFIQCFLSAGYFADLGQKASSRSYRAKGACESLLCRFCRSCTVRDWETALSRCWLVVFFHPPKEEKLQVSGYSACFCGWMVLTYQPQYMCVCVLYIYCYLLSVFRLLLSVRLPNGKQFIFGCGLPYWRTASGNPKNNRKTHPS